MHLTLFFTFDTSLNDWYKSGLLDRELIIYRAILSKGDSVSFLTYGDDSDYDFQDMLGDINIIPVYDYIKRPKNKILRLIKSFFIPFYIKKQIKKTTILKTNQLWGSWVPVLIKLFYNKSLVVRCGFEHYYQLAFYKELNLKYYLWRFSVWILSFIAYKAADSIILTSKTAKIFVSKTFKIHSRKISVLYNIIDTELFKPIEQIKYNDRIVFLGRLTNAKNLFSLLDAISKTKYKLDIIGDGELKVDIKNYIAKKNIMASMLGIISNTNLPKKLCEYKVLILPSFYEGNPKALLEAMACGLIVVCSNIPSLQEIITKNTNGILTDRDSNSIKSNLIKAMELNPKNKIGNEARKFILDNCKKEFIINKEYSILQKLNS